jgi:hypothetical protein
MKRRLVPFATLATLVALTGVAGASWSRTGAGSAFVGARHLPTGPTPSLNLTGTAPNRGVAVTWAPVVVYSGGPAIAQYVVRAYNATSGLERSPIGAGCAGTITATTCTEATVPSGTWKYSVTARLASWQGAESPRSAALLVDNVAPTGVITSPANGATVTRTVPVTSNSADTGGSGLATVAFQYRPHGTGAWTTIGTPSVALSASWDAAQLTDGSYDLQVVNTDGVGNQSTSPAMSVTVENPRPTSITVANGNGNAASGDTVTVVWSRAMKATSFCSTWTSGTSITGNGEVTVTISNNGSNPNDDFLTVAVTGNCANDFNFGTINLGANYTPSAVTFSGNGGNKSTIVWTPATFTMTIMLGSPTGSLVSAASSTGLSYTPDSAIQDTNNVATAPVPFTFAGQRF